MGFARRHQKAAGVRALSFGAVEDARFAWRTYSSERFERNYSAVAAGMISGEGFAAVVVALAEFAGASPLAAVPGRCE